MWSVFKLLACVQCGQVLRQASWIEGLCLACASSLPLRPSASRLLPLLSLRYRKRLEFDGTVKRTDVERPCIVAPCYYQGNLPRWLRLLKFHQGLEFVKPMSELMTWAFQDECLRERMSSPDLIMPVPLSKRGLKERGYNQADLLAQHLAKNLGVPCVKDWIEKDQELGRQSEKEGRERFDPDQQCYILRGDARAELRGKSILLVDDLTTSGSTLYQLFMLLGMAGVERIQAVVFASSRKE